MQTTRLLISGRVQGVGYRDWAQSQALAFGLNGWVRNLRDGRVELVASGEDAPLARFVEALRQGPSLARVDAVAEQPGEALSVSGFEVRPTA
ncbi:acylphosphatase [Sphingomonas changbaiensis NBRC 104936]|uniref:acylphosphatase n=1 Tax=Sphingomonas changbaiensis NBRC 104936 TaxID=1219043 RepID=A0A0E9MNK4_9SPHN|nr:acylphosphatase [Sphingomonas changbaiensis]GAO38996.1 acylphosphatase [Sphingomonas changbaiensis NBRC 104936]